MSNASIELLESRIAPAVLLPGGKIVTFTDTDGDAVTVKFSKPILTDANVGSLLIFDTPFGSAGAQHLISVDVSSLPATAKGVNISVSANPGSAGGNGEVDINSINGSNVDLDTSLGAGIDLGKVRVDGSVNFIDAGDTDLSTPALKSLKITRLGAEAPGVESSIHGSIGTVDIRDTMQGKLRVAAKPGADASSLSINSIHIGGSLLGGTIAKSGSIEAPNIDLITIDGSIFGGAGDDTGRINATNLARVIVHGSIVGGTGLNTAVISAGTIDSAAVDGSLVGTSGFASARLVAGTISKVRVGGDIVGGDGDFSGQVRPNFLGDIRIGGNLFGGSGISSGQVGANDVDSVIVGGSVVGAKGDGSGTVGANTIDVVRIGGDLVGGAGNVTGQVIGGGQIRVIGGSILGRVPISGDVSLAAGLYASIFSIDRIRIGGDVIAANIVAGIGAGIDKQFGTPDDTSLAPPTASITSLRIGGHIAGPSSAASFGIEANAIGNVRIGDVSFTDGEGNVDFSKGILVNPQGTVKLRTLA